MTKKMMILLAVLFAASPMLFAQGTASADVAAQSKADLEIRGSLAMAIASGRGGLAQGKAVAGALMR